MTLAQKPLIVYDYTDLKKNNFFSFFFLKSINFDEKKQICIKINTIYSLS